MSEYSRLQALSLKIIIIDYFQVCMHSLSALIYFPLLPMLCSIPVGKDCKCGSLLIIAHLGASASSSQTVVWTKMGRNHGHLPLQLLRLQRTGYCACSAQAIAPAVHRLLRLQRTGQQHAAGAAKGESERGCFAFANGIWITQSRDGCIKVLFIVLSSRRSR